MIYILMEHEYGFYEGEPENHKILFLATDKEILLNHLEKMSVSNRRDLNVIVLEQSEVNVPVCLNVDHGSAGVNAERFYNESRPKEQKPPKTKKTK